MSTKSAEKLFELEANRSDSLRFRDLIADAIWERRWHRLTTGDIVTFEHPPAHSDGSYLLGRIHSSYLDSRISPLLKRAVCTKIEGSCADLILDMTYVETIDTTSLATLLEFTRVLTLQDRRIRLAASGPAILKALKVTRMDRLIPCVDSVDSAIQSLGRR